MKAFLMTFILLVFISCTNLSYTGKFYVDSIHEDNLLIVFIPEKNDFYYLIDNRYGEGSHYGRVTLLKRVDY